VATDFLGRGGKSSFVVTDNSWKISTRGGMTAVDCAPDDSAHFCFPQLAGGAHAPKASAFPVRAGSTYVITGSADVQADSQIRIFLIYFDKHKRIGRDSVRLGQGSFSLESEAPKGAKKVALVVRASGRSRFALRTLSVREVSTKEKSIAERQQPALKVAADFLGKRDEASFVAPRRSSGIFIHGQTAVVEREPNEDAYLCFPQLASMTAAPAASAFPVRPDCNYIVTGSADVLGDSEVRLFLIYFDEHKRIGRDSARLAQGSFSFESEAPRGATKVAIAVRASGRSSFSIRKLAVSEAATTPKVSEPPPKAVLPSPERRQHVLTVATDFLGRPGDARFIATRYSSSIFTHGTTTVVDCAPNESVYFCFPRLASMTAAPSHSAFPVRPGQMYVVSGVADVLTNSELMLYLIYFDEDNRVGRDSAVLRQGSFYLESVAPEGATKVAVALRAAGQTCFAVRSITVTEVAQVQVRSSDEQRPGNQRNVVMIVANDIQHDSRVQKTARSLVDNGYNVTLFGMWRNKCNTLSTVNIRGVKALIFPDPGSCLFRVSVPALRWTHMTSFLQACMWSYVEKENPRFIHTHDYHALPLGMEFSSRLRKLGHRVDWLHDFHDYVPGYDHMDDDMKEAILTQEALGISHMDHRFTVSSLIAEWLSEQHDLDRPPTLVMNAPLDPNRIPVFERSIRADLELPPDLPLIVYTGGAMEMKGLHTVAEALSADSTWHFAIVTDRVGPYIERLKDIAERNGTRSQLHFLPYVPAQSVPSYLRDASIGIIPFRRYGNGDASLPNKLYDYLHAGMPVVTSDCTLMKDFVRTWRCGEVFKAEDVADCANAIQRAVANRSFYRSQILSNTELLRECTWEAQEKNILAAYRSLEARESGLDVARAPGGVAAEAALSG
jgi:glycosyltransferase involved in cell wall biosynthesis